MTTKFLRAGLAAVMLLTAATTRAQNNSSPVITAQFPVAYTNQITLYAGASPTFSINATSPAGAPVSYSWFTNGVAAMNATNAVYQLTNAQLTSPTNFFCVASNVAGMTTGQVWSVTYVTAPAAPFAQAVLALNPVAYWRLNEADDGLNDGNPGVLALDYVGGNNGIYANAVLGQTGYDTNTDTSGTAALFGSFTPTGSFAGQIGTNIDFSVPAGSNAEFTIEAWVNGLAYKPTDTHGAGIVAKGYFGSKGSAEVTLDEGAPNEDFRLEVHSAANTAYDANSTINAQNSGWHFLVGVCDEANSNVLLYVDGVLAGSVHIAPLSGVFNIAAAPLMIGSRSTSVTTPGDNQFQGLMDNVAIYNYALTPNQVLNQYLMSGVPASLPVQPPTSAFIAPDGALTVAGASVFGTPPLTEQWWDSTLNTPLAGQTNAVLTISNSVVAAGLVGHQIFLAVSNIYGGTNSVLVTVSSNSGPIITTQLPIGYTSPLRLFAGANPNFSITASAPSGYPISYQWFTNGIKANGKTNTFYQLTNAQLNSPANFYCVASNTAGMTTSMVWSVTYVATPTAPFPQSVLALNPIAYWRLNESDDGTYDGNPGAIAYDYVGGNDGIYTNALLGQLGYNGNTDASETSTYFGYIAPTDCFVGQIGTNIDFSAPAGSNAEFTIEAWVNGLDSKPTDSSGAGIVGKGYFGSNGSAETTLDEGAPNEDFRLEVHTPDNTAYDASSTINAQSTGWHFLVGVCDEANSNVLLYVDGVLAGSTKIPALSGIINTVGVPLMIGARPTSALTGGNNQFVGLINDVAVFNYALSPNQVLNQYLAAGISPNFLQQPAMNAFVTANGLSVTSATIIGTPPLTEQWWDATLSAPIIGQTNTTLAITNVVIANSLIGHQLYLAVTNSYGATNSGLVTVNSNSSPVITAQFPVSYTNQITLYAGASPTFSINATSPADEPISYFWFTNGVSVANATNAAYQLTNAQLNSPTNFFCVVSNVAGTTTSMVWSVTYLAAPTAPFVQSVLALNPVAYWRLNEADDGINDGNPGALAIDYVGGNNAIYTNVVLGQAGYNASTDPTATAASFGTFTPTGSFAGQIGTNLDFSAPTGSNAEFTIEAWVNGLTYKPTNSSGAGIVAKGYFGSKGSAEMTLDEGAANEDFRLEVHSPANKASDAGSTINAQNSGWHFLVGVCDEANGKVLLYVDGVVAGSVAIAPLTGIINTATTSLMIGARSTSVTSIGNNQFQGLIDNVAIYNYALTPNQVATQYQAGAGPVVNVTATNIVFSASNNQMTLSWPADHTGWQLQAQTNSLGTNWVTIGGSSLTNQVKMAIDPSNKAVFYRLIYFK